MFEPDPVEKHLLLLLYARDSTGQECSPVRGQLWLQKEMFLIAREVPDLNEEFEEFRLGPFSESVDDHYERLSNSGYIEHGKQGITLTQRGRELAQTMWVKSNPKERELAERVKKFANDLSSDELLVFIYKRFPDYTTISDVKDSIEAKRLDAAVSLFKKDKISLSAAAEISGKSISEFREVLQSRGLPVVELSSDETREELLGVPPNTDT